MISERVIFDEEEIPIAYEKVKTYLISDRYALCRCGQSGRSPFCDGSHLHCPHDLTETADRKLFREVAHVLKGRNLILYDRRDLCMRIGFCHLEGSTWVLTKNSDTPYKRALAIKTALLCPSGRLVVAEKETNFVIEVAYKPHISLIEDRNSPNFKPIWLKGGISVIGSDGREYEVRKRIALCSCGRSQNKPYCDGTHYFA